MWISQQNNDEASQDKDKETKAEAHHTIVMGGRLDPRGLEATSQKYRWPLDREDTHPPKNSHKKEIPRKVCGGGPAGKYVNDTSIGPRVCNYTQVSPNLVTDSGMSVWSTCSLLCVLVCYSHIMLHLSSCSWTCSGGSKTSSSLTLDFPDGSDQIVVWLGESGQPS